MSSFRRVAPEFKSRNLSFRSQEIRLGLKTFFVEMRPVYSRTPRPPLNYPFFYRNHFLFVSGRKRLVLRSRLRKTPSVSIYRRIHPSGHPCSPLVPWGVDRITVGPQVSFLLSVDPRNRRRGSHRLLVPQEGTSTTLHPTPNIPLSHGSTSDPPELRISRGTVSTRPSPG